MECVAERKCLHCKKNVTSSIECLKCAGFFHPACMAQANEAKNKSCRHMDSKSLVKEFEAQNKLIQKLITKIEAKEDNFNKQNSVSDILNATDEKIIELSEKVEALENEINRLKAKNIPDPESKESPIDLAVEGTKNTEGPGEGIGNILAEELRKQSEGLNSKLDNVAKAIISTNKDLVRFLTQSIPTQSQFQPKLQSAPIRNESRSFQSSNNLQLTGQQKSQRPVRSMERQSMPNSARVSERSSNNPVLIGRGAGSGLFSAGERRQWLYLGRCDPSTTEEHITDYLKNQLSISDVKCLVLDKNDDVVSFKIGVKESLLKGLLDPNLWPVGTAVKEFRPRRLWAKQTSANFRGGDREDQSH